MPLGAGPFSANGTKLWIGTTAVNGATDTFIQVGSLESLGAYGVAYSENVLEDLSLGVELTYKGIRKDGAIQVGVGYDLSDAGQAALLAALANTTADYNIKVTYNDVVAAVSASPISISVASPAVVTDTAHNLLVNTPVSFSTTGTLPTGLLPATTYYVKTVVDANSYQLSATVGGAAIVTTLPRSGVHTRTTVPAGTFDLAKAKIMTFQVNPGSLSTVVKAMLSIKLKSGTLATTARIPLS